MKNDPYNVLKIYASTTDKLESKLLYEYIVHSARERGLSGITVYRGIMGYGSSSKQISSSRFWELTDKLPVVIEVVDRTSILEEFYQFLEPELQKMPKGCLVTTEPVRIRLLKPGKT